VAYNVTAWRCGGIRCSFCRQLKPIKDIMFNGFYCCLIYNIKLKLPMNSELLLMAPTSCRHNAKPIVVCCLSEFEKKCQSCKTIHNFTINDIQMI